MSLLRCAFCEKRCVTGVSHVYWFAPGRDGGVFRYRQRLCLACLAVNVLALTTPEDAETLTCSACGISVDDDVWPIYMTWYVKRGGATRGAMALCEQHQLEIKLRAAKDATPLEDRDIEARDSVVGKPMAPASDVFSSLGRIDPGLKRGPSDGGALTTFYRQGALNVPQ
jgi:hypothetical protein